MKVFQMKYSKDGQFNISIADDESFTEGSPRNLKRSEIKRNVKLLEKGLALVPDSTSMRREMIDSFYINKYKIQYIKDHGLARENIILIE